MAAAETPPLLAIVGPTASGKSDLAVGLAERLGGEIISADSVQIYRHFDVGSGKPTEEERRGVPHHLIDAIEPDEEIDASLFAARAARVIDEVRARGHLPIVCGGTFLWLKALLYGLVPAPPKDTALRQRHQELAERDGREALHARLAVVDPDSHARLEPNDLVRVSRALEVFELTGKPLSALQREHGFSELRYDVQFLGIRFEPEQATQRIERRVRGMFERGWLDEVRELLARGFAETRPMKSVGYKEVHAALSSPEPLELEPLIAEIVRVTRVFSRRQRTWLRERPVRWLTPEEAGDPSPEAWGLHGS